MSPNVECFAIVARDECSTDQSRTPPSKLIEGSQLGEKVCGVDGSLFERRGFARLAVEVSSLEFRPRKIPVESRVLSSSQVEFLRSLRYPRQEKRRKSITLRRRISVSVSRRVGCPLIMRGESECLQHLFRRLGQ